MSKHGLAVEKFYSHGAEQRALEARGFLSFGYWKEAKNYVEAAEDLLDLLLEDAAIVDADVVLNVCCGNGVETETIFNRVKPREIHGLDITQAHIDNCNNAFRGKYDGRMIFHHADATRMTFENEMFSHVIGIEGIAHMDTREAFFREARRVLRPGGSLVLSDCILRRFEPGLVDDLCAAACAKVWHVPAANRLNADEYKQQLEANGFRVDLIRSIGRDVYPGFAAYNATLAAMKLGIEQRGLRIGLGVTIVSWLLGETYRRGLSDYVIVKATKI